ncbi:MAG: hypothetical protein KDM81_10530, partial [Verrucomicrobiae bacterium]|nr:hypothetical protein [Verrucomicrobiae bacterium]
MQVTSLMSRKEAHAAHHSDSQHHHDHHHHDGESCSSCGHDHEHALIGLWQTLIGLILVINSYVLEWVFPGSAMVASASAMIGAIILGFPIVMTSVRDLQRGILSINELVTIAVLAAFGSGDYQTAGVVAFFMLMGELIETRTAAGARA